MSTDGRRTDVVYERTQRDGTVLSLDARLALRREEAAAALGISDESFDRYVRPHLRVCRWGSLRLYPIAELERFLLDTATSPVEDVNGGRR
jgi:hypothetical protein